MNDEIKIEKSFARGVQYILVWTYVLFVFLAIGLSIIFAIFRAWSTMLIADALILFGLLIIFFPIYWIAKAKDKTFHIFTCDTIKEMKGDAAKFTAHIDDIESIEFFSIMPFLDITIFPSPTLIINLKSKNDNRMEIRIFCNKSKIEELKKVFKKEIVMHK